MPNKMADVGGRRRLGSPMSAANIFRFSFLTFRPTSSSDVGPAGRHSGQRQPPTLSVQFSGTQANTQSVTLVMAVLASDVVDSMRRYRRQFVKI